MTLQLTDAKIKRIDAILKRLGFIEPSQEDRPSRNLEDDEKLTIINTNNVVMLQTYNKELKKVLNKYRDFRNEQQREIGLNYHWEKEELKAKHSSYYTKNIVELINVIEEDNIIIQAKNHYPLRVYNEYCELILAPRGD